MPNSASQPIAVSPAPKASTHALNALEEFVIPDDGVVLQPRRVYLGTTVEEVGGSEFAADPGGREAVTSADRQAAWCSSCRQNPEKVMRSFGRPARRRCRRPSVASVDSPTTKA